MQIKLLVSAAAITLVAGVGSASADENFGTFDGISAFDALPAIQAAPLNTDEMASITAAHWYSISRTKGYDSLKQIKTNGIWDGHEDHGIIYCGVGNRRNGLTTAATRFPMDSQTTREIAYEPGGDPTPSPSTFPRQPPSKVHTQPGGVTAPSGPACKAGMHVRRMSPLGRTEKTP